MSHLKGIAFESPEVQLQKLRERLRKMWDAELIQFGKTVRIFSGPRVSRTPDPWKAQLEEARAEWRRRHPKHQVQRRTRGDAFILDRIDRKCLEK